MNIKLKKKGGNEYKVKEEGRSECKVKEGGRSECKVKEGGGFFIAVIRYNMHFDHNVIFNKFYC